MRRAVISYGEGRDFEAGLNRLEAGFKANGIQADLFIHRTPPQDCPAHWQVPYGFKPWFFEYYRTTHKQVIWLDASCVPVKSFERLWYELERDGCLFQVSPLSIGEWCSDAALETMGITREQALAMKPSMWNCAVGLDFRHKTACEFLEKWLEKSRDGRSFQGAWTNEHGQASKDLRVQGHRHDQTIATILAYQLGMPFNEHVVHYDIWNVMPLEYYKSYLRLPWFPAPILNNHNAKGYAHPCSRHPPQEVVYDSL